MTAFPLSDPRAAAALDRVPATIPMICRILSGYAATYPVPHGAWAAISTKTPKYCRNSAPNVAAGGGAKTFEVRHDG